MRKLIGFLMLMIVVLAAGCAGGPNPVRRATVGSAKAVGKGTVWAAKKTGQGVVYVTKAGTKAVKSIGGKKAAPEPDTLVQVGDKPLEEGKADLIEQEVAERESGEFDTSDDTRTASKSSAEMPVSSATRSSQSSSSSSSSRSSSDGWSTKGASDDGMLAADDPGDLAFSGSGSSSSSGRATTTPSGDSMPPTPSGEIRYDLPELDIDATLAAAEGRSTKK